ncbi:leader peptidase (prepilin peptidase)/N-methyltransferase [Leifsonia sp. AK011]|uniref:prepilin peptidase n=1 Tax=Leifsonia sp. AK011 TaxID=2723075 RepID=UPI0015CDB050|nr:prepilin peptidase [Leifsonia sp. AK011]NYF10110.1 leader peptidase (prepilin peptidase)/N-methyltransferase [Leifsonia sp. AK011]
MPSLDTRDPRAATLDGWSLTASAVLGVATLATVGLDAKAIPALYLAAVTPPLVFADVTQRRLPNPLVLPGYPVVLTALLASGLRDGELPITAFVAGVSYLVAFVALVVGGGMGMGDAKLAGLLGLSAGLLGVAPAVATVGAAFLLGGVSAIVSVCQRSGAGIPFGPHLLAGYWIALLLFA